MLDAPLQQFLERLLQIFGVDIEARRKEEIAAFEKVVQIRVAEQIMDEALPEERDKLNLGNRNASGVKKVSQAIVQRLYASGRFEQLALAQAQALLAEKFKDLLKDCDARQKEQIRDALLDLQKSYPQIN